MYLVVNEWLVEFLIPPASTADKARLQAFFDKFMPTPSKIVIGRVTPFTQKFYRFLKQYERNDRIRRNFLEVKGLLFQDSLKTIIVEPEAVRPVAPHQLVGIHDDDWYLIHLANSVRDSVILSIDARLIKAVTTRQVANILHLDAYLRDGET
jgi:hypothetical protein